MAVGQRQYTEDDKATALALLAANDGNLTATSLALGIPDSTIQSWRGGRMAHEYCLLPAWDCCRHCGGLRCSRSRTRGALWLTLCGKCGRWTARGDDSESISRGMLAAQYRQQRAAIDDGKRWS